MGADDEVHFRLVFLCAELSARGLDPDPELCGLIRAVLLEMWDAGAMSNDVPTVPAGKQPMPRGCY